MANASALWEIVKTSPLPVPSPCPLTLLPLSEAQRTAKPSGLSADIDSVWKKKIHHSFLHPDVYSWKRDCSLMETLLHLAVSRKARLLDQLYATAQPSCSTVDNKHGELPDAAAFPS